LTIGNLVITKIWRLTESKKVLMKERKMVRKIWIKRRVTKKKKWTQKIPRVTKKKKWTQKIPNKMSRRKKV